MTKFTLFFALSLLFSGAAFSEQKTSEQNQCDIVVRKFLNSIGSLQNSESICLSSYFAERNLGKNSFIEQKDGSIHFTEDEQNLDFDDMILFDMKRGDLDGMESRRQAAQEIYQSYMENLQFDGRPCELQIMSGSKVLQITDFKTSERNDIGQPGSRLSLTKEDVSEPSWKMVCEAADGSKSVVKQGQYFFIFIDVYEKKGAPKFKNELSKFLFALRQK